MQCPAVGAQCTGGVLLMSAGYWVPPINGSLAAVTASVNPDTVFYRCPPDACEVSSNGTIECAPGRDPTSPLCALCLPNHYLQGSSCVECPPAGLNWPLTILVALMLLALYTFTTVRSSRMWKTQSAYARVITPKGGAGRTPSAADAEVSAGTPTGSMTVLKVGVSYLQVMGFMKYFSIPWPSFATDMWTTSESSSSLPLGTSFVSCTLQTDFYTRFLIVSLAPAAAAVALLVLPAISRMRAQRAQPAPANAGGAVTQAGASRDVTGGSRVDGRGDGGGNANGGWTLYRTAVLIAAFLLYPSVTRVATQVLACSQPVEGRLYLEADFRVECGTPEHSAYVVVAVLVIVCFCLGLPMFTGFTLWKHRQAGTLSDDLTRKSMLFLYKEYRPEVVYWESVIMLRKAALAVTTTAVGAAQGHQAYVAMLVVLVCLVAQQTVRPFANESKGTLETLSLTVSAASLYLGILFTLGGLGDTGELVAVAALAIINFSFVALLVFTLVSGALTRVKTKRAGAGKQAAGESGSLSVTVDDVSHDSGNARTHKRGASHGNARGGASGGNTSSGASGSTDSDAAALNRRHRVRRMSQTRAGVELVDASQLGGATGSPHGQRDRSSDSGASGSQRATPHATGTRRAAPARKSSAVWMSNPLAGSEQQG